MRVETGPVSEIVYPLKHRSVDKIHISAPEINKTYIISELFVLPSSVVLTYSVTHILDDEKRVYVSNR